MCSTPVFLRLFLRLCSKSRNGIGDGYPGCNVCSFVLIHADPRDVMYRYMMRISDVLRISRYGLFVEWSVEMLSCGEF